MRLSLRYRLLVPLGLLLLGAAGATGWAAAAAAAAAERRVARQQWAVARTLSEARAFPLTRRVLEQMKGLSGAEFLLARADGTRDGTFPDPQPDPPAGVPTAAPGGDADHALGPPVAVAGRDYRCLRLVLGPLHPNHGDTLDIFYPEDLLRTAVRDAARPPLVVGVGGGLAAAALAAATGGRLVRRVRELQRRTRLIAAGDFRPMTVAPSGDELEDLADAVNDMARRLAAFQDERGRTERLRVLGQFSGGLAHQLRNAAAGAKLAIELFLAENPAADPEPLRVALRQLARIESNLRQFLELGKPSPAALGPCDLGTVLGQTVALLGPQCRHANTALTWEPPPAPVVIPGDPTLLGHLFGNLVGNAVEAAGPGGAVEVWIAECGPRVAVEVSDTGPGPPADIADRVFDPFVTGKEGGIGLGLAVAKQAADAHGGRVTWTRRDGRTVFRVELPGSK